MTERAATSEDPKVQTLLRSNNLRGALWLVGSGVFFTVFLTLAKFLSSSQDPVAIAFWRSFVGLLVTFPAILRQGKSVLTIHRPWLIFVRSLAGTIAFLFSMIAISEAFALPLSQFNALSFTRALFLTILAAIFLRESVGIWRWAAVAIGFLGIVIMVMPGLVLPGYEAEAIIIDGGTAFAIGSAFGFAVAISMVKTLSQSHSPMTLLIWGNLFSTVLLAIWLLLGPIIAGLSGGESLGGGWQTPNLPDFTLLILMALTGVAAQYCYINAMAIGDASFLAPVDYLRLPMAAVADWFVFKLLPGLNVWLGALIIVSATLIITLRERSKRAQSVEN